MSYIQTLGNSEIMMKRLWQMNMISGYFLKKVVEERTSPGNSFQRVGAPKANLRPNLRFVQELDGATLVATLKYLASILKFFMLDFEL